MPILQQNNPICENSLGCGNRYNLPAAVIPVVKLVLQAQSLSTIWASLRYYGPYLAPDAIVAAVAWGWGIRSDKPRTNQNRG